MITIEIKGPAGSGKSAVAQGIATLLREAGFTVNDSPEVVRSQTELRNVLASLTESNTVINIVEKQKARRG